MLKNYKITTLLFLLFALVILAQGCGSNSQSGKKKITLRVISPAVKDTETVYVSGNNKQLGEWKFNSVGLDKINDTTWEKSFYFEKDENIKFKFSKGSLSSEAVSPKGMQYYNVYSLDVKKDTVCSIRVAEWMNSAMNYTYIKPEEIDSEGEIKISNGWRFRKGDNLQWAEPAFDDSSWSVTYSYLYESLQSDTDWDGLGWFRLHLNIDSSLINMPLSFTMSQAGASEVYLDGKLIYKYGRVGASGKSEISFDDRDPKVITFKSGSKHLIAVRYSNYSLSNYYHKHLYSGFVITLGRLNEQISQRVAQIRKSSTNQMIFTSLAAAFALMHFFLFLFYPKFKENLYYAICMLGFAIITYSDFQTIYTQSVSEIILLIQIASIAKFITIVFGLLMVYSMSFNKIPKYALAFIITGVILAVWTAVQPFDIGNKAGDIFLVIAMVEMIRSNIMRKKVKTDRSWIVFTGFMILCITLVYQLLVYYNVITPIANIRATYLYGALALSISMSIYLSQKFAHTNKNLEFQLVQVKELSEQALEQERFMKEQEIQQRLLEADNKRKTQELEEARQLQLSMLPKEIPSLNYLKIAAFMKTAQEVGGDYYDFLLSNEKVLTAAIGDATGHGLRAGTMVTAAKSLFNEFAHYDDIKFTFEKFTKAFKLLNFDKLYMAMLIIKIENYKLKGASAGMPAPIIYRKDNKTAEALPLKGMPLGCFDNFPYNSIETELKRGDVILLMSDGYPELFNENNEEFGYDNAKELFCKYAELEPEEIINRLISDGERWAGSRPQDDDITFVVIKVT